MLFNTAAFGIFFAVIATLYWALRQHTRARLGLLLLASYYFYASWDVRFVALIAGVTLIDYFAALVLTQQRGVSARRLVLAVALGLNLGLLGFWKYAGFFIDTAAPLLSLLGLQQRLSGFSVMLPVGISFFTFQGLSYLVDVYRGDIPVERSPFRFALFIAFFPQLVAGPIVRAPDLLHQFDQVPNVDDRQFGRGLAMMLGGLLKKVVLADFLAANLVDRVFDLPSHYGSLEVLAAIYAYALQIYGDFSGYSDIAIGAALVLGFALPDNFNAPYRADGFRDFWRRWHISLSTWLRDYLYISLGGSRGSRWNTSRNLMITMVLGGLWHGASYNFVLWGLLHGLLLVIEHHRRARPKRFSPVIRVLLTFHAVAALWVVFRAHTLDAAVAVFAQLFAMVPGVSNLSWPLLGLMVVGYLVHFVPRRWSDKLVERFAQSTAIEQATATIAVMYMLQGLASANAQPFIYFQF